MAKLQEIAALINVSISGNQNTNVTDFTHKPIGRKRRPWVSDESDTIIKKDGTLHYQIETQKPINTPSVSIISPDLEKNTFDKCLKNTQKKDLSELKRVLPARLRNQNIF